jgi:hypothetical protein
MIIVLQLAHESSRRSFISLLTMDISPRTADVPHGYSLSSATKAPTLSHPVSGNFHPRRKYASHSEAEATGPSLLPSNLVFQEAPISSFDDLQYGRSRQAESTDR